MPAPDPENDDILERIRAMLGEHWMNFGFVVLEDDGTLFYDYTNPIIGRALFENALEDMQQELDLGDLEFSESWEEAGDEEE